MVVVDQQYDIQIINPAAIRLLGIYTAAIGKDLIHLVRPSQPPGYERPSTRRSTTISSSEESDTNVTVVTVETALGEQRRLQVACYPHTAITMAI